ncbi:MAG: alpha-D-ribose 1-methylphosphonate 5-triphosphate diphosphatase [Paracoccaceae bacterium]
MTAFQVEGARVMLDDRVERVALRVENGRIAGIDVAAGGARRIDAAGVLLAPAFVDIHGDAFERQLMPRPGVMSPVDVALFDTDRQLAANRIATAYHAHALDWEPGLRSVATARTVLDALARLAPRLAVENRVQVRWETFCLDALPFVQAALGGPVPVSFAFNDHTSMAMLDPSVRMHDRPFELDPAYPQADVTGLAASAKLALRAQRSGVSAAEYVALLARVWDRRPGVRDGIEAVAAQARAAGVPMLSHDDTQTETRRFYRGLGARIAEFPMHRRVLAEARAAGDLIAFGAPNAMRGGSHLGSLGAAAMIAEGFCDILASDYYYPAMLGAVARLHSDRVAPLPALWKLVSENPARAMGLPDRGRIVPGLRADLQLIDWPEGGTPSVVALWSGGRAVFGPLAR